MTGKTYAPMSVDEAEKYLYTYTPDAADAVDIMDDPQKLIYAEILKLHQRIDEIENQANEMMSPDKMSEMATKFLGGGMGGF